MKKYIVITTIHDKSTAIKEFEKFDDWHIVLVGDVKSVAIQNTERLTYLSIKDQLETGFSLARIAPENHYARKNIGYLFAISNGADIIYDTDDDNIPYPDWSFPPFSADLCISSNNAFINTYKYFTNEFIWPRGFPLDEILNDATCNVSKTEQKCIAAWQGLADEDPDVDAIYRLIFNKTICFRKEPSIYLPSQRYAPFNSQNTLWSRAAFPLIYLPSTVTFRLTDILRGYIAQRLFWEHNMFLGFTSANVYQERNIHNLLDDFSLEYPGYTNIKRIIQVLDKFSFSENMHDDLIRVYESLLNLDLVEASEVELCKAWVHDLQMYKHE